MSYPSGHGRGVSMRNKTLDLNQTGGEHIFDAMRVISTEISMR